MSASDITNSATSSDTIYPKEHEAVFYLAHVAAVVYVYFLLLSNRFQLLPLGSDSELNNYYIR